MDTRGLCLLSLFCVGLLVWLYLEVDPAEIDYEVHDFLINGTTGERTRPIDVINLENVIKRPAAEHINQTNAMERLFELTSEINRVNYMHSRYQFYSKHQELVQSGWPVANQEKCAQELAWIRDQLTAHKNYSLLRGELGQELTQLIDSFGRPESGLYSGELIWPGSYEQCKRVSIDNGRIKPRYCVASMRPRWWPSVESGNLKARIKIGICIPETCDTLSYETQRESIEALIKHDLEAFISDNLLFDSLYCLPDERSPIRRLPVGGWIFLMSLALWLAIQVVASVVFKMLDGRQFAHGMRKQMGIDLGLSNQEKSNPCLMHGVKPDNNKKQDGGKRVGAVMMSIVRSLAIQQSWATFMSIPMAVKQAHDGAPDSQDTRQVNLSFIALIKCLTYLVIICAHSVLIIGPLLGTSPSHNIEMALSHTFYMAANLCKLVDSFFLFAGLFAAYVVVKRVDVNELSRPLVWFLINLKFLIRIWPIFLLMYWYARTVEPYTGQGPWWDYGTFRYSIRGICQHEPWWRSIPYFSHMGPQPRSSCQATGWFVIVLAQITLIVPLMIYLIQKLPSNAKRSLLMVFITFIMCMQTIIKFQRQVSIKPEALGTHGAFLLVLISDRFESLGMMNSLGRLNTVACGCYIGYLLHMYEIGAIRKWPSWLTSRITFGLVCALHLMILILPMAGKIYMGYTNHVTSLNEFLVTFLSINSMWPVLNGILIINLATVYPGAPLVRSMSHPFWHVTNKLGLAFYLIHWDVLIYLITAHPDGPPKSSYTEAWKLSSLGLIISLVISLFVEILFNAPITALLTRCINKILSSSTKRTHKTRKPVDV